MVWSSGPGGGLSELLLIVHCFKISLMGECPDFYLEND